jgi:hypothetical protein
MAVLEAVANGQMTPEAAAELMLEQEREAREKRRPTWLPRWAWTLGTLTGAAVLTALGVRHDG